MSDLKIARGFALPIDLVTRKTAILAKSGAGKSNTAKVIVEGVLDAGAQVVIIDPVGHWWGLRSLFPIPVLGGMNGDIPLDPLAGKLIADVAAESGQSLILDVSLMDSDGEMQRFAYEFAERFYKQKQLHPTAVLIVLEEADEFAPQDTRGANVPRMVGAWARIAKRGRGRGIGLLSVTLRSASLSKNVLNQSDGIVAMRTTAPLDIKAVQEWVQATRAVGADEVIPSLPSLETGEAWFWIPEYGVLERVKVTKARSLDTSATPEVGAKPLEAKTLKPIDLAALGERMQSTVERAKENDPAELRKQVRDVKARLEKEEREHGETIARPGAAQVAEPEIVEVPVFNGEVDRLDDAVGALLRVAEELREAGESVGNAAASIASAVTLAKTAPAAPPRVGTTTQRTPLRRPAPVVVPDQDATGGGSISRPQQRILDALAWFEAVRVPAPRRSILAPMAVTTSKSSGFEKNLSTLRTAGLINYGSGSTVYMTDSGRGVANPVDAPATAETMQEAVISKVSRPQGELLRALLRAYPKSLSREQLANTTGASALSSGFEKNLSTLRTLGVIDYPERGYVAALPLLFLEDSP